MNLPQAVEMLIEAQNNFDAKAYASNFSIKAIVADEGHTYNGRAAVKDWIEEANRKYKAKMKPLSWENNVLKTELSGSFPGSPIVVKYKFGFEEELISSLTIE